MMVVSVCPALLPVGPATKVWCLRQAFPRQLATLT